MPSLPFDPDAQPSGERVFGHLCNESRSWNAYSPHPSNSNTYSRQRGM